MAIISLNPDAVREYSLKEDAGPEKTVFLLGALDSFVIGQIGKQSGISAGIADAEGEEKPPANSAFSLLNLIVIHGLKGWKNFCDPEGRAVSFETEQVEIDLLGLRPAMKRELLRRFTLGQIAELAREIQKNSVLSKQERGN